MPASCDVVNAYGSSGALVQGFEGIPQNLIINVVTWIILLILFLILRKSAWNYGRLKRVTRSHQSNEERVATHHDVWTTLFYGDNEHSEKLRAFEEEEAQASPLGWKRFFPTFLLSSKENQLKQCGPDANLYQTFQVYIILFTGCIAFLCIAIILPFNMSGSVRDTNKDNFATTTISNLSKDSTYLWAHLVIVVVAFAGGFLIMLRFSKDLRFDHMHASATLMIVGIPRKRCQKDRIVQHFREAYPQFPEIPEDSVFVVYDFRKLTKLQSKKKLTSLSLAYSVQMQEETGQRPLMMPSCCARTCCCSKCCIRVGTACQSQCLQEVDAIDFYTTKVDYYKRRFEEEIKQTFNKPVGIAFVTFQNVREASIVLEDHQSTILRASRPPATSMSTVLKTPYWDVNYAPYVDDILWANLHEDTAHWWMRAILINFSVFIIFFFMTTPAYVLNLLNGFNLRVKDIVKNPLLVRFLPSLILWLVSVLLPFMVFYSDQLIGYWTKTTESKAIMIKTYLCLIFMVLILPSLGLTSMPSLLKWLFPALFPPIPSTLAPPTGNDTFTTPAPDNATTAESDQWACVFMPDSGAFFVNYIITAAIIGTIVELLRFSELIWYGWRMMSARSEAEQKAVTQMTTFLFDYGTSYAWVLCIFAVTMSYSVICPLIMPVGLLYQILKYGVDRYNLFYAYGRTRIDKNMHGIAVTCALVSLLFPQINLLSFLVMRMTMERPLVICALCAFLFSILAVVLHIMLVWCRDIEDHYTEESSDEIGLATHESLVSVNTVETHPDEAMAVNSLNRLGSQEGTTRRFSRAYQPEFIHPTGPGDNVVRRQNSNECSPSHSSTTY